MTGAQISGTSTVQLVLLSLYIHGHHRLCLFCQKKDYNKSEHPQQQKHFFQLTSSDESIR